MNMYIRQSNTEARNSVVQFLRSTVLVRHNFLQAEHPAKKVLHEILSPSLVPQ